MGPASQGSNPIQHDDSVPKMRQSPLFAALLICEAFIAFALGVFGNKVADILNISTGVVISGASLAIITLYLVTLARLRYEAGVKVFPEVRGQSLKITVISTGTTVFPVGMACGIGISVLSIVFLPGRYERPSRMMYFHDYELVTFVAGLLLLLLIARRAKRKVVTFIYGLGYGLGAAAIVQVMEPRDNAPRTLL